VDGQGPGRKVVQDLNRVRGRGGWRMKNKMVSVLWAFNRSFHIVKYLHKVVTALLNLQDTVSGRQDRNRRAVSSAYKAWWVCRGSGMSER
jgi:hypothetical protein